MLLLGATTAWGSLITSVGQLPAGAYDFINFDSQGLNNYASGNSLRITSGTNTVTFTGTDGQFRINNLFSGAYNTSGHYLDNGPYTGYGTNPNGTLYMTGPGFNTLKISFLSPVEAFGFNMGAIDNCWVLAAYDVNNDQIDRETFPTNINNKGNTNEFYGLTSSSSNISYVYLIDTGKSLPNDGNYGGGAGVDWVFMDNFRSSDPPLVPIPGTVWLLGSALVALAGLRRFSGIKPFVKRRWSGMSL